MTAPDRAVLAGHTLGTVDLVAVDRVRNGYPAELTDADRAHLFAAIHGTEETRAVARALGLNERAIQRLQAEARNARLEAGAVSPP